MKNISKAALATTLVVGATLLSSTSASAFQGQGMRERGGEERYHLISQEMREEFRAKHKAELENLSEEERVALREQHREERKAHREANKQEVADFIGVSVDELKEARESGTSIEDLLTDKGISQEDAEAFLTEQANERVDAIAERHELDTEQEATIRERISEFVENILGKWFK